MMVMLTHLCRDLVELNCSKMEVILAHPCWDKEEELYCNMVMLAIPCWDMEEDLNCNMVMLAPPCWDMEEDLNCNMVMLGPPAGTWRRSSTATW